MGLIAEDPWQRLGYRYEDRTAVSPNTYDKVAEAEHNWYSNYVPDSADVDPEGQTTYSLSVELRMDPGRCGYTCGYSDYRNQDARVQQRWKDSGLSYEELTYDPVGDNTTDYDYSVQFTVSPAGSGAAVGVDPDAPKISHQDISDGIDEEVEHDWGFPGSLECSNARCSEVLIGNAGRIDAYEPSDTNIDYCPTETSTNFRNPSGYNAGTTAYFNPQLSEL